MASYNFQPYNGLSPSEVKQRYGYGSKLLQEGSSVAPVGHWTQAIARGLQGLAGGYVSNYAGDQERQGQDAVGKVYKALMDGQATPQQASAALMQTGGWGAQQGQQMANAVVKQRMAQSDPMNALKQRQIELQMKLAEGQASRQNRLFDMDLETRKAQAAGNLALIIQNEKNPAIRAQHWQRLAPTLPPQYQSMPLEAAIPALISRAGMAKDYISMNRPEALKVNTLTEGGSIAVTDPRTGRTEITLSGSPKVDATTKKEIQETDDFVQQTKSAISSLNKALALNKTAYAGAGAESRAALVNNTTGLIVNGHGAIDTTELATVVTTQALQSLRSTFGGNPTEGERKILLDVAGSVSQPAEVRERIYKSALDAAKRRLEFNKQKNEALRRGTYYQPGGAPVDATTQTSEQTQSGGGGPRYINPQTGEMITWNGSAYVNAQGIPISDAQGRPYAPASR